MFGSERLVQQVVDSILAQSAMASKQGQVADCDTEEKQEAWSAETASKIILTGQKVCCEECVQCWCFLYFLGRGVFFCFWTIFIILQQIKFEVDIQESCLVWVKIFVGGTSCTCSDELQYNMELVINIICVTYFFMWLSLQSAKLNAIGHMSVVMKYV